MEVELTPAAEVCADCGGCLRRIGEVEEGQQTVLGTVCP